MSRLQSAAKGFGLASAAESPGMKRLPVQAGERDIRPGGRPPKGGWPLGETGHTESPEEQRRTERLSLDEIGASGPPGSPRIRRPEDSSRKAAGRVVGHVGWRWLFAESVATADPQREAPDIAERKTCREGRFREEPRRRTSAHLPTRRSWPSPPVVDASLPGDVLTGKGGDRRPTTFRIGSQAGSPRRQAVSCRAPAQVSSEPVHLTPLSLRGLAAPINQILCATRGNPHIWCRICRPMWPSAALPCGRTVVRPVNAAIRSAGRVNR